MDYVELNIRVADDEQSEIIVAELADYPFESFTNEGPILKAYIPRDALADCMEQVNALLDRYGITDRRYVEIEQQNWNALWESHFEPVEIDGRVIVRAPFHAPRPEYGEMEIVIMPQMSFGTGHHATTRLMIESMLETDLEGKQVLDMGCGTGVLSIVAVKRGAAHVDAVDIDDMAFSNCGENASTNGAADRITPILGDVRMVAGRHYDTILANINRNILLRDMPAYAEMLHDGGRLIMSGFLDADVPTICEAAHALNMKEVQLKSNEGWAAVGFVMER